MYSRRQNANVYTKKATRLHKNIIILNKITSLISFFFVLYEKMKKLTLLLGILICSYHFLLSQNVLISDDATYSTPNSSAVLDIYSKTAGLLIPRMTTSNRTSIASPVAGLLVYDTDEGYYYIYTASGWQLMQEGFWLYNSTNKVVYLADNTAKVGIGTSSPTARFEVHADATASRTDALFEVKNTKGQTVFAVYDNGVRIYIDTTESKAGSPGGFAIKGIAGTKASRDYMWVTADSIRFYIDTAAVTAGSPGGFAIKGVAESAKGIGNEEYLRVTRDSTRVYVNTSTAKAGSPGGFAIKGLAGSKGINDTRFLHLVPDNYFIGHQSGINITSGKYNTFFGYQAGKNDSTGSNNVFIGYQSGMLTEGRGDSLGQRNVFLGYQAGYHNLVSSDNVLLGYQAGFETESGGNVIAIGSGAGYSNVNNSDNIFIGRDAGFYHTGNGTANQAINNIYIGLEAGMGDATAHNQGENNIFMGVQAGMSNTTGTNNIFLGYQANANITTGSRNISIGNSAGLYNQTTSNNIFIGNETAANHQDGDANVVMGVDAFAQSRYGSTNLILGNYAGYGDPSFSGKPERNVILGDHAAYYLNSASDNIFIGYKAAYGKTNDSISGSNNVVIGNSAALNLTKGNNNVMLGYKVGYNDTIGSYNVFLGYEAGFKNQTGNSNVYLGYQAGHEGTFGRDNVIIGQSAGYYCTSNSNVYIGTAAGQGVLGANDTAYANVSIGLEAAKNITSGWYNVVFGFHTGHEIGSGKNNVFIGPWAGGKSNDVDENVYIGNAAGYNNENGERNVFLGAHAGENETGSDKLYIDNTSTSDPLIYGDFAADEVHINGTLTFNTGASSVQLPTGRGTNGNVLATDGAGSTYWTTTANLDNDWTVNGNDMYSAVTGIIGIGTNAPATNTKLHVLLSGTPVASQYAGTVAAFQQNANAGDWSRISIIGGNVGASVLDFGDDGQQDAGYIKYDHDQNAMVFQTDGAERLTIDNGGNVNLVTDGELNRNSTGDANLVPIAYGNISSSGSVNTSTGNISVSHTSTGIYDISITGETYYYTNYITNITIVSGVLIANAASAGGNLRVIIRDPAGNNTDGAFTFTVYKP